MSFINNSFDIRTTIRTALPIATGLLGAGALAGGVYNFTAPYDAARLFGIVLPPQKTNSEPARRQQAYIQIHGIRNIASGVGLLGLVLYRRFSPLCQNSPLASLAVKQCLGILLTGGALVGLTDGWILARFVRAPTENSGYVEGLSSEARELGGSQSKGHAVTAVGIAIVALGWFLT